MENVDIIDANMEIERLRNALKTARFHIVCWQGEPSEHSCSIHAAIVKQIDAALDVGSKNNG